MAYRLHRRNIHSKALHEMSGIAPGWFSNGVYITTEDKDKAYRIAYYFDRNYVTTIRTSKRLVGTNDGQDEYIYAVTVCDYLDGESELGFDTEPELEKWKGKKITGDVMHFVLTHDGDYPHSKPGNK